MKIGFTGTRRGMTASQCDELRSWFRLMKSDGNHLEEFHHGDAVGADTTAAGIAKDFFKIVISHSAGDDPLGRNKVIVDSTDLLIACPAGRREVLRSGTWMTIRYAEKQRKKVIKIWP